MRPAAAALLALLAALAAGCGGDEPPAGKEPAKAPGPAAPGRPGVPGIVVLCIDTLRADEATLSGPPRGRMPALEAFAREATAFPEAVASSSWTPPSVATMLTGLLPSRHGVQGERDAGPLVGSVTTLAEVLSAAGWHTAAYTAGGWLVAEDGIGQGFAQFEPTFDSAGPEASVAKWAATRPAGKPFFLFLHTNAAHDPYGDKTDFWANRVAASPEASEEARRLGEYADAHGGQFPPEALREFMTAYLSDVRARVTFGRAFPRARLEGILAAGLPWLDGPYAAEPSREETEATLRSRYEAALPYVDGIVARALRALEEAKLPAGTATLVLADHGEAFGEHRYLGHGRFLNDELVRVPFALKAPGRLPAGGSVRVSGGVVDVTPTLLDLAGVPAPEGLDGRSLLSVPDAEAAARPVLAESVRSVVEGGKAVRARVVSARSLAAKYLLTYDAATGRVISEEVFDLEKDPGERAPLPPSAAERFGGALCRAARALRDAARRLSGEPAPAPREACPAGG